MPGMQKQFSNKINDKPYDAAAERMVLSALLYHGGEIFYDIDHIVKEHDFYLPENRLIYSTIKNLIVEKQVKKPDLAAIIAIIRNLDSKAVDKYEITEYLGALSQDIITPDNAIPFCQNVARFALVRNLEARLLASIESLHNLSGDEKLSDIINIAEKPVSDFTLALLTNDQTIKLSDAMSVFLESLATNQPKHVGIPSGYPIYDKAIGGGFRPGVHLEGARPKQGKSFKAINIAWNLQTYETPVPTLYLDTELNEHTTLTRTISRISGVPIDDIENGAFAKDKEKTKRIAEAEKRFASSKFYYHNISGKSHQEWVSIIRRWIMKEVGFKPDGKANDCLIILDYLKMMDLGELKKDVKEYQYLGQVITDLHNLTCKYSVPIYSLLQLNRDGIDSDGSDVIADSDRLLRLCTSFSIFRKKNEEDFADDPPSNGNRRVKVCDTRFGRGMEDGEYINYHCDYSIALITEKSTNLQNRLEKSGNFNKPQPPPPKAKIKEPEGYKNVFERANVPI